MRDLQVAGIYSVADNRVVTLLMKKIGVKTLAYMHFQTSNWYFNIAVNKLTYVLINA